MVELSESGHAEIWQEAFVECWGQKNFWIETKQSHTLGEERVGQVYSNYHYWFQKALSGVYVCSHGVRCLLCIKIQALIRKGILKIGQKSSRLRVMKCQDFRHHISEDDQAKTPFTHWICISILPYSFSNLQAHDSTAFVPNVWMSFKLCQEYLSAAEASFYVRWLINPAVLGINDSPGLAWACSIFSK